MCRSKRYLVIFHFLFSILFIFPACERTIEEEVIKPIESMYGQKDVARALAAESNVRTVRAALMRYPATSPSNQYPGDMDIYDYGTLREVLADENLPPDMTELMWDAGFGVTYTSDGYSFTLQVKALTTGRETITATPNGVTKN
jgi:hypothetical protein